MNKKPILRPHNAPLVGDDYVHFKGGRYRVRALCIDSSTLGCVVAYQAVEKGLLTGPIWIRTLEEWTSKAPKKRNLLQRFLDLVLGRSIPDRKRFSKV